MVVREAQLIVLAVPTHRFRELPHDLFAGRIVVDAMNYWQPIDGDGDLDAAPGGSSLLVRDHFPGARVVKTVDAVLAARPQQIQAPRSVSGKWSRHGSGVRMGFLA